MHRVQNKLNRISNNHKYKYTLLTDKDYNKIINNINNTSQNYRYTIIVLVYQY